MKDKHQLLKVLVGSRAHGLAKEDADYDFRGVYIVATSDLVSMGYKYKGVSWVEGETEDQTSYELANFLNLALQGHPNILEMFVAPDALTTKLGQLTPYFTHEYAEIELKLLFPDIWSPEKAYSAFTNYANNRRKNMFNAENREVAVKSAYCHIRVLYNLVQLLTHNTFSLEVKNEFIKKSLKEIKAGKWTDGQVIDLGRTLEKQAEALLPHCDQKQDEQLIKNYLVTMRKKYWILP